MLISKATRTHLVLVLSITGLALSACSTQGASRYGDTGAAGADCGTVMVPCGPFVTYAPVQGPPPTYLMPAPCPMGQCETVPEPAVVVSPPIETAVETPYVPPLVIKPPYEPLVTHTPVVSCPEGSIASYGGDGCIPIAVPRK